MVKLKLKLTGKKQIMQYADKYLSDLKDVAKEREDAVKAMKPAVRKQGCLTKRQLKEVACWKSPRRAGLIDENSLADVKSITGQALAHKDDCEKIKLLTKLQGVGCATASAILHWFDKKEYPIWDFRAVWSCSGMTEAELEAKLPSVGWSCKRWRAYTDFCRKMADKYEVDMRTLDRALFKYYDKR